MNSLIIMTALIAFSSADDGLFQYCDDDICEGVTKYTILEYQDLCFEEKIVKFENSLGATHYVGLNQENVASKYVKLCGSATTSGWIKKMWRPNMSNFVVLLNKTQLRDRITIFSHNRSKLFLTQKKMKMHKNSNKNSLCCFWLFLNQIKK